MFASQPPVRCRQIDPSDLPGVIALLARGFPDRHAGYWERAVARLDAHPSPPGYAKYGYVLESDRRPVGTVLTIFTEVPEGEGTAIRCNLSSWYVEPEYRSHAALLIAQALRRREVSYLNISPAPHTEPIIAAQGFTCYCRGKFIAPLLQSPSPGLPATILEASARPSIPHTMAAAELMRAHAALGCLAFWVVTPERAHPFVFLRRRILHGLMPAAQLIYCDDIDTVVRFAQPIGRHLAGRGLFAAILDTHGPLPGLIGRFTESETPRYIRGPVTPRLGDLAYTELALFGA